MSEYVWIKRDLFECPKHQGYTGIRDRAGTWSREETPVWLPIRHKYDRSHDHYALPVEEAPEFTNACFDDLARDHLKAKCAAKDAEIAKLREENDRLREALDGAAGKLEALLFDGPDHPIVAKARAALAKEPTP